MKRLLSLVVFLFSLSFSSLTHAALWEGYEFAIDQNGCKILSYTGKEREINIPLTFDNYYVIEIADGAFENNKDVVSIFMPATIERIGKRAFAGCVNLEYVYISNSVADIDDEAFLNCGKLTVFTLPANLKHVGKSAFDGCYSISYFNDLSGEYQMRVESHAFDDTEWFKSQNNDFVLMSQGYTLLKYRGNDSDPEFPWYIVSIAEDAFAPNNSITTLHLPNYVASLTEGSISGMSKLQAVLGNDSISTVEDGAFRDLPSLETVELNEITLTSKNFLNCPLSPYGSSYSEAYDPALPDESDELFLSAYNEELDGIIILHCLRDVSYEDGELVFPDYIRNRPVVVIGEGACQNRKDITTIFFPKFLIGIESWAFSYDENLTKVVFPDGIKWIKDDAFTNSGISVSSLKLEGVDVAGRAFYNTQK